MKKALQNPFIVGTLAIVAMVVVFRSTFKKEPTAAVPAAATLEPAKSSAGKTGNTPPQAQKKIDATLADWTTTTLHRNPFNAIKEEPKSAPEMKTSNGNIAPVITRLPLTLSAILFEGKRQLAVINGQVVGRGDRFLDYDIEDILADQVILHGSGGRTVVAFPEPSKSAEPIAGHSSRTGSARIAPR